MNITGHTSFTGLVGTPIKHSISPAMHNEGFRKLGIDWVYLAFETKPEDFEKVFFGLIAAGCKGMNMTMPYKVKVTALCDELTPASQIAGASNTIIIRDDKIIGHTTDGIGFMEATRDAGHDIIGKKMTLLGCGGAATAIATQAALDGVTQINIFEQGIEPFFSKAQAFAAKVNDMTNCRVTVTDIKDLNALRRSLEETDMLTNATNVGMKPLDNECLIPDASYLRPDLIVCDIVYNPLKTRLYLMAESAGCPTFNGLYMMLYQGAASFREWTGHDMPIEAAKKVIWG